MVDFLFGVIVGMGIFSFGTLFFSRKKIPLKISKKIFNRQAIIVDTDDILDIIDI